MQYFNLTSFIDSSEICASSMSVNLAATEIPFSIVKLVIFIAWFFGCFYCIQRINLNPTFSPGSKAVLNFLSFFIGPVIIAALFIKETKEHSAASDKSMMKSLTERLGNLTYNLSNIGHRKSIDISIFDTSGKNIKELYGQGRAKSQDRKVLDLTENIIIDAVEQEASDILIDPKDGSIHTIRFRIDGVLREVEQIDSSTCQAVINSIKVVSKMDIAEKRRPQDGAFVAKIDEMKISFRAASAGVLNGEKLSLRVLNQDANRFQLETLGLSDKQRTIIERAIKKPSGMILMNGPTGSGKTTTLYAMLNKIDLLMRNVVTVEDPIEYVLPHASQIEVNPKADITFAKSLRSMLRQDPDIIVVGEIRDEETAQIAMRAAQTGHLVFATIHSNNNISALIRLTDLGITPAMLSEGLSLLISQRLVRKLCSDCMIPGEFCHKAMAYFKKHHIDHTHIYKPVGCDKCYDTGYIGRVGVYDVLAVNQEMRKNILSNQAALMELRKHEETRGRSNLQKEALKKVVSGYTSMEELSRVIGSVH